MSLYLQLFGYFLLGGGGMLMYAKNKKSDVQKALWTKFRVYFLIVFGLLLSVNYAFQVYQFSMIIVFGLGVFEIIKIGNRIIQTIIALAVFAIIAFGFISFNQEKEHLICITYLTVLTMDGFSQIVGQLFGKHKLWERISPSKTIEGTLGGFVFAILTYLSNTSFDFTSLRTAFIIIVSALAGDLLASYYKRLCQVKDYSQFIPGHGGILDRFDSFIFTGFVLSIANYF